MMFDDSISGNIVSDTARPKPTDRPSSRGRVPTTTHHRDVLANSGPSGAVISRDASVSSRATTHSHSLSDLTERSPSRTPLLDPRFDMALGVPAVPAPRSEPPGYEDATGNRLDTNLPDPITFEEPVAIASEDAAAPLSNPPLILSYGTVDGVFQSREQLQPEDMGGLSQPLLGPRTGRRRRRCRGCCCINGNRLGKILAILGIILVAAATVAQLALRFGRGHNFEESPSSPTEAPKPTSTATPSPVVDNKGCPNADLTGSAEFYFKKPEKFSLVEMAKDTFDWTAGASTIPVSVRGRIRVRQMVEHVQKDVSVRVEVAMQYTHSSIFSGMMFGFEDGGSLELFPPSHISSYEGIQETPCVLVEVNIWVRPGAIFDAFLIASDRMDILIEDVGLHANSLHVETYDGAIHFPDVKAIAGLQSRDITVRSRSGRIEGSYPLYDSLDVSSASGEISVSVHPKPIDKSRPKPARLDVSSGSGRIDVNYSYVSIIFGRRSIPDRDYQTFISSSSSSIEVFNMLHGSKTSMKTASGSIKAVIVPAGPLSEFSDITIDSESGSIDVQVQPHLFHPHSKISKLNGNYTHGSSSLKLQYPRTWEGKLEGFTISGSVKITWPGMVYFQDKTQPHNILNEHYYGHKGNGDGTLIFEGTSGRAELSSGGH